MGSGNGGAPRSSLLPGISCRDRSGPTKAEGNPVSAPRAAPAAGCPSRAGRRGQPRRVWQAGLAARSRAGCSASLPWRSVRLPLLPGSCPPGQVLGYRIQMLEEDDEFT